MKIDHIALYVSDLDGAKRFFCKYFRAVAGNLYHNPSTGLSTYFLSLPDGGKIEIMTRPEVCAHPFDPMRRGLIHLAISVGSKGAVDALTSDLKAGGYEILSGPRTTGDGYYESCVRGFENNILEITI